MYNAQTIVYPENKKQTSHSHNSNLKRDKRNSYNARMNIWNLTNIYFLSFEHNELDGKYSLIGCVYYHAWDGARDAVFVVHATCWNVNCC